MIWKGDFFRGSVRFVRVPPYESGVKLTNLSFSWQNCESFWGQKCWTSSLKMRNCPKKWRVYMHIRARIHKYMTGGHRVIGIKDSHSMVTWTHWHFGATSVLSVLCRFSNNISNMCQCLASLVLAPGLIVRCIKMITTQYWMDLASCLFTVFCCSRVNGWMDMAKDRNIFARMHET